MAPSRSGSIRNRRNKEKISRKAAKAQRKDGK
jgi:hypothetical protein